jgi:HEPN domain-containing protein
MTGSEEAQRMLTVAEIDLKALRNMLDPELFEDSVFGFHAQQAVEKVLKAWLSLYGLAYPKTHDLRFLMNLLQAQARVDCERFAELADLTDFAVQFRYDFSTLSPGLSRTEILSRVEALWDHVEQIVGEIDATTGMMHHTVRIV